MQPATVSAVAGGTSNRITANPGSGSNRRRSRLGSHELGLV